MMKTILPLNSSLSGKVLIEASAGTGKTYTITSLVIRYLLGINLSNPLKLDEILIVTFTRAATAELRLRIYERILEAQQALIHKKSKDSFIQELLSLIPDEEYTKARLILNDAERLMNDANIFTIHSFCQRFLSQNPLDSNLPFDATLEISDKQLKSQTAKQFWREVCYYFSDRLASIAHQFYINPDQLEKKISSFLSISEQIIAPKTIKELEEAVFNCKAADGSLDENQVQSMLYSFAAQQFNYIFYTLKRKKNVLFFDDLIKETEKLITQATPAQLKHIQNRYQVAMIDEFQDTDASQYRIFSQLFGANDGHSLLMIGDPKQSIYKFRGADIDTYLQAKHSAVQQYSLGTNYRSSSRLVMAINELFQQNSYPFLTEEIPFYPVDTPKSADNNFLTINQIPQKGIGIVYLKGKQTKSAFQQSVAQYITTRIQQLLQNGEIYEDGKSRCIQNQDITILVRGKGDAEAVLTALHDAQLPAVYLSDKKKVFASLGADLIYHLLQSLLDSRNQELMKQTFASLLYQLSLNELHQLLNDHLQYEEFLIEREQCLREWDELGIIPMLDRFLHRHQRIHHFRNHPEFDRIMTDIRHICELLQAQSLLLPTKEALLDWFNQQIQSQGEEDDGGNDYSLRLESEMNVITIMTIHGAKGLEFPITFIPSNFEAQMAKPPFIVDTESGKKAIEYNHNDDYETQYLLNEQAENMRLLYVALTRAKYYCEFALAEQFTSRSTHINEYVAFSTLLNTGSDSFTFEALEKLQSIQIIPIETQQKTDYQATTDKDQALSSIEFTSQIDHTWGISSFTQLTRNKPNSYFMKEQEDEFSTTDNVSLESTDPSIFTFPKGAHTGTFIHELFEKHLPSDLLNKQYLAEILSKTFFSEEVNLHLEVWVDAIHIWLDNIFQNKLLPNLSFADALQKNALHELEFLFPVTTPLTNNAFNDYLNRNRSQPAQLDFYTLQGMMKGFIDLIFVHDGKFYIADYKTNHLGYQQNDYSEPNLHSAMLDAYYDVQYLIYSVALVRYLTFRLPNFNYDEHFGGIFYLFVRGMSATETDGIYFRKPKESDIRMLDKLMGTDHE